MSPLSFSSPKVGGLFPRNRFCSSWGAQAYCNDRQFLVTLGFFDFTQNTKPASHSEPTTRQFWRQQIFSKFISSREKFLHLILQKSLKYAHVDYIHRIVTLKLTATSPADPFICITVINSHFSTTYQHTNIPTDRAAKETHGTVVDCIHVCFGNKWCRLWE